VLWNSEARLNGQTTVQLLPALNAAVTQEIVSVATAGVMKFVRSMETVVTTSTIQRRVLDRRRVCLGVVPQLEVHHRPTLVLVRLHLESLLVRRLFFHRRVRRRVISHQLDHRLRIGPRHHPRKRTRVVVKRIARKRAIIVVKIMMA